MRAFFARLNPFLPKNAFMMSLARFFSGINMRNNRYTKKKKNLLHQLLSDVPTARRHDTIPTTMRDKETGERTE